MQILILRIQLPVAIDDLQKKEGGCFWFYKSEEDSAGVYNLESCYVLTLIL